VIGFDATTDLFDLPGSINVTGIDTAISGGRLSVPRFDDQLQHFVGATQLGAHHAVLFTPDDGAFAGHTFLVVDANGVAGYQAGQDLAIDLQNATNLNIHIGNFV
jgi:hypothetical protein